MADILVVSWRFPMIRQLIGIFLAKTNWLEIESPFLMRISVAHMQATFMEVSRLSDGSVP